MASLGQIAFRIKIVNADDLERLIEMGEAAESLAEDLPWRDEPKQLVDAIERLIEGIDVEAVEE